VSIEAPSATEIHRDFGVALTSMEPGPRGFVSDCWIADGRWFVKVWPNSSDTVDLGLLDRLAEAGLPVPRPLRSEPVVTDKGNRYAVFPYVRGRHADASDWRTVARMLRRVHDMPTDGLGLRELVVSDEPLVDLRPRLNHPWVADRADELVTWLDRFEEVLHRASSRTVPLVLSHDDFGGGNMLLDGDGHVVALLDWDDAGLGPREHDLWLVIDEDHPREFLDAYGVADVELDSVHLEYGLLRRALGDLAARVVDGVDQPGVTTWGFDRLARVDATLALFGQISEASE
jgi:aminoglycoside phosphotransferase (APT) family kinase protein